MLLNIYKLTYNEILKNSEGIVTGGTSPETVTVAARDLDEAKLSLPASSPTRETVLIGSRVIYQHVTYCGTVTPTPGAKRTEVVR